MPSRYKSVKSQDQLNGIIICKSHLDMWFQQAVAEGFCSATSLTDFPGKTWLWLLFSRCLTSKLTSSREDYPYGYPMDSFHVKHKPWHFTFTMSNTTDYTRSPMPVNMTEKAIHICVIFMSACQQSELNVKPHSSQWCCPLAVILSTCTHLHLCMKWNKKEMTYTQFVIVLLQRLPPVSWME